MEIKIITAAFTRMPTANVPKGITVGEILAIRGQPSLEVYRVDSDGSRGCLLPDSHKIKLNDTILIEPFRITSDKSLVWDSQASD